MLSLFARTRPLRLMFLTGLALVSTLFSIDIFAQSIAENNILEAPLTTFRDQMVLVRLRIGNGLNYTFWALATLEFTWALGSQVFSSPTFEGLMKTIIMRIMYIGFFWWVFKSGYGILDDIVSSFQKLGAQGGGVPIPLTPDNILDLGLSVVKVAVDQMDLWNLGTSLANLTAAVLILIAFVVIAAHMVMVLLEFYVVGYGGFVLLAFGGNSFTKEYAITYLKYGVAVGMKFFTMMILIGLIYGTFLDRVQTAQLQNLNQLWTLVAFSLLMCIVVGRVPQMIQGFLQGVSISGGTTAATTLAMLGGAATAMAGAAASMVGAASAVGAAASVGGEKSGGSVARGTLEAGKALTLGSVEHAFGKLSGRDSNQDLYPTNATTGGAIARNIQRQSQDLKVETIGSSNDTGSPISGAA